MAMSDFLFQKHHKRKNEIGYIFCKKTFKMVCVTRGLSVLCSTYLRYFSPLFIGISMACCKVHFHYYYYILRQLKSISYEQFDNKHLRFSWPDKNYIIGNLRQMVQNFLGIENISIWRLWNGLYPKEIVVHLHTYDYSLKLYSKNKAYTFLWGIEKFLALFLTEGTKKSYVLFYFRW